MILQNSFNGTFSEKIRLSDQKEPSHLWPLTQKATVASGVWYFPQPLEMELEVLFVLSPHFIFSDAFTYF